MCRKRRIENLSGVKKCTNGRRLAQGKCEGVQIDSEERIETSRGHELTQRGVSGVECVRGAWKGRLELYRA